MRFPKKFPDTITIILVISVLFIMLTWVVPAGEFEREVVDHVEVIVADSYQEVPANPQGIGALLMAPIKGMVSAAFVIAFIFIVGGAFAIINRTDAINAGIYRIILFSREVPSAKKFIVPAITALFSLAGATFGMSEEILVFILITIPLARALHYDNIIAAAIPIIGTGVGFAGAVTNPFTIGIAQSIAEIPLFSGMEYRLIVWFILTTIACIALQRYASKIDRDPSRSPLFHLAATENQQDPDPEIPELNLRRKLILIAFLVAIILLVLGVNNFEWYINEIAALFLGLAVVSAIIYRLPVNTAIRAFTEGAKDMMTAALVIALSKGLLVISQDGKIIDTMLNSIALLAGDAPTLVSAELMFVFQCTLNFFIPSGSGQAALTMPIMAPLSDLLGVSRQVAVLAFQMGDGLTNMIVPTSGVTMGVLSIAKIPYDKWFRWSLPYLIVLFLAAFLLLVPPVLFFAW